MISVAIEGVVVVDTVLGEVNFEKSNCRLIAICYAAYRYGLHMRCCMAMFRREPVWPAWLEVGDAGPPSCYGERVRAHTLTSFGRRLVAAKPE